MSNALPGSRSHALRVVAAACLTLVSMLVLVDHVRLSRWVDAHPADAQETQVTRLERKFSALQAALAAISREPAPVSAAAYAADEKQDNDRLARIEQSLSGVLAPADLVPLADRVTRLEAEVWRLRHPKPAPLRGVARAPIHTLPMILRRAAEAPPFIVLGAELRGGESFLAVSPPDPHALSEVRVLRPGEADGHWRLKTLDAHVAVFEVDGRLQRLPIP